MKELPIYMRVICEFLRYDAVCALKGFAGIQKEFKARRARQQSYGRDVEDRVCKAVRNVTPWYWKRVQCLQRSVAMARVLRAYGVEAEVVVGYRLAPFLAHAWVEAGGRVIHDSAAFPRLLRTMNCF